MKMTVAMVKIALEMVDSNTDNFNFSKIKTKDKEITRTTIPGAYLFFKSLRLGDQLTNTGSDNGLSPGRHQAIIWTNAGILLIGPLGTYFNVIWIEISIFSFRKYI